MADTDLLRASRDGDQFHYHWAARQAPKLLLPGADLTAIAIEGVSHDDTEGRDGEDVIDIAEYYGATGLREANRVVYRQLKHSTTRATEEWTVSGLAGTVSGFAEKFRWIRLESPGLERKVTFEFLSNRPVRDSVLQAIGILAAGGEHSAYAHQVKFLKQYAGFSEDADGEAPPRRGPPEPAGVRTVREGSSGQGVRRVRVVVDAVDTGGRAFPVAVPRPRRPAGAAPASGADTASALRALGIPLP